MLVVQHLSKSVSNRPLFTDISFVVGDHHTIGLVGPNGAGKTTLLNIILGREEADEGNVITSGEQIGYLPQKLNYTPNQEIGQHLQKYLTQEWEAYKIDEALAKVGLKDINIRMQIEGLSGGQKMKVGLAGVLLTEPTTLLLDEPTNNLDVESIIWLERFVQQFSGKVLLISHDRYFLDNCVDKIIELDPSTHSIVEYGGNYTAYTQQKARRQQNLLDAYELQQEKETHMRDWIVQKQEQLKFHQSVKVARQLKSMKTRFAREIVNQQIEKPQTYTAFRVQQLAETLHQKKVAITVRDFHIHDLIDIPILRIFGADRIHLCGVNGSGKTTLLQSLLHHTAFYSGDVEHGNGITFGYFSQEHELLNLESTMIDFFMGVTRLSEGQTRSILGKYLFSKDRVFAKIKLLSEGEKARLSLALLITQHTDFLFLDEPTNHLDLESREVLTTALREYEGGFIVVSHDRYFVEHIGVQRTLTIQDQQIIEQ